MGGLGAARLVDHRDFRDIIDGDRSERQLPIPAQPELQHIARAILTLAFAQRHIVEIPGNGDLIPQALHLHVLRSRSALLSQDRELHFIGIDDFQAGKLTVQLDVPGIDPAHIRKELGQAP